MFDPSDFEKIGRAKNGDARAAFELIQEAALCTDPRTGMSHGLAAYIAECLSRWLAYELDGALATRAFGIEKASNRPPISREAKIDAVKVFYREKEKGRKYDDAIAAAHRESKISHRKLISLCKKKPDPEDVETILV